MTAKRGLGRGLGALISDGEGLAPAGSGWTSAPARDQLTEAGQLASVRYAEIPIELLRPNPKQPRQVFDEAELAELVMSIKQIGLLQPVVVRTAESGFELVVGERRWRACQQAGFEFIPALIRATPDDALLRDALLENLHRSQLNVLEEAAAYQQLLVDFGCTTEELATRLGRSRPHVANTIRLLKLPLAVQRRVAAGVLSAGHARALLSLDENLMESFSSRIVAEGLSVRAVEELVAMGRSADAKRSTRTRRPRASSPDVSEYVDRIANRLDTRVRVEIGARRGRVIIEVASLEDLERVIGLIAPQ
jgi:ParB family chromosome partitioning protein